MSNFSTGRARHPLKMPLVVGITAIIAAAACKACGFSSGTVRWTPPPDTTIYVGEPVHLYASIENCSACSQGHANLSASGAGASCSSTTQLYTSADCTATPTEAGVLTVTANWGPNLRRSTDSMTLTVVEHPAEGAVGAQGAQGAQGVPGPQCGNGTLETGEACEPGGDQCGPNQTCNTATCQCESSGTVTASASTSGTTQVNLRPNPGPGCEPATLNSDSTLILDARSSTEPVWYHVQGDGWVYSGALEEAGWTFQPDPSTLPVDTNAVGCLYCGDGVCSAEIDEAANTCEADCPAVCGDGYVTHDEACDPPESEPPDPAYGDDPVTWCNDTCQYSTKEPPAEPPFDDSACGHICSDDPDCPSGFSCVDPGFCTHPSCP